MNPTLASSTDRLLAALRRLTQQPALTWRVPPAPLTGGFWAEMYVVELADAPPELDGRLVARIMPDSATAAWETALQRHLARCGFPVPGIRFAEGPSSDLDRAWSVMDFAPGQPLPAGLNASTAIRQIPMLMRHLPEALAEAAAALHRCPLDTLHDERAADARQPDVHAFLARLARQADVIRRPDLSRTAEQLAASAHGSRVICHGDLHPFNLLVDSNRWTLIDWSAAVLADPHYDIAFTTLMLANPPLGGPAPTRAIARQIGNRLARRFLRTYEQRSGHPVDHTRLVWGQRTHALRALVEIAAWEANDGLAAHHGHPWLTMRPVLEAQLR